MSRNFYVRKYLKLTFLNEMEALYERPGVNVTVEQGSTLTYTRDVMSDCIYARKIYVRMHGKITRPWKSTHSLDKSVPNSIWLLAHPTRLFLARLCRPSLAYGTLFARNLCLKIVTQLMKKLICSSLSMSLALCYCQGAKLFCPRSMQSSYLLENRIVNQCSQ